MCVVTEELSRGYIGVGSLGTRSEIAAELIRHRRHRGAEGRYLPKIASGEIIPTAVFTEPDTGSDLAALQTRAILRRRALRRERRQDLDHPRRARRPDDDPVPHRPGAAGYRGLSILLAEKPRGTDAEPFPVAGLAAARSRCSATAA